VWWETEFEIGVTLVFVKKPTLNMSIYLNVIIFLQIFYDIYLSCFLFKTLAILVNIRLFTIVSTLLQIFHLSLIHLNLCLLTQVG
jgi:hypothetical protein